MQDRGYKKWIPFNSVIDGKVLINDLLKDKNKVYKPTLSEDQIEILNEKIFEAYTNHIKVKLSIFKNMNITELTGYINNINTIKKYITFNNTHIFLNQIINIDNIYC